jgi:two-component system, chemotaxis family, chemotaxis protein CheY
MSKLSTKVLVVDDYSTMRKIVRNVLGQIGFANIEEAGDGNSALEKLKTGGYGLVISDWNMEPMSGLELLKTVRANGSLKEMPFIMVTAEGKPENVVTAKDAGVNNYVVKPFSPEILKKKIEAVLGPLG